MSKTLLEARTLTKIIINERSKLIKIADKHVWDTVNKYPSDPLAKEEAGNKRL